MSRPVLAVGDFVAKSSGLAVVHKVGRLAGTFGYWIVDHTGDPGASRSYPTHVPAWSVRAAIVGETICDRPAGHGCGLTHVTRANLIALGVDPADIIDHVWPAPSRYRKPIDRVITVGGVL